MYLLETGHFAGIAVKHRKWPNPIWRIVFVTGIVVKPHQPTMCVSQGSTDSNGVWSPELYTFIRRNGHYNYCLTIVENINHLWDSHGVRRPNLWSIDHIMQLSTSHSETVTIPLLALHRDLETVTRMTISNFAIERSHQCSSTSRGTVTPMQLYFTRNGHTMQLYFARNGHTMQLYFATNGHTMQLYFARNGHTMQLYIATNGHTCSSTSRGTDRDPLHCVERLHQETLFHDEPGSSTKSLHCDKLSRQEALHRDEDHAKTIHIVTILQDNLHCDDHTVINYTS